MSAEVELTSEEAYQLLKLAPGATEAQVKSAYRKLSLKLHPDKRRDVPPEVAAHEFHRLAAAYALLSDPVQREKSEAQAAEKAAAAQRRGAYDSKRKAAAEDLVRREEEDRKRRRAAAQAQSDLESRLREAQEESERMMQTATRRREEPTSMSKSGSSGAGTPTGHAAATPLPQEGGAEDPPPLGPMDRLVLLKLPTSESASLLGVPGESLLSPDTLGALDTADTVLYRALGQLFGNVTHMVVQPPKRRKKGSGLSSEMTVMAEFEQLEDAFAAVAVGGKLAAPPPLDECWIGWASSSKTKSSSTPVEPARIAWMRSRGLLPLLTETGQRISTEPAKDTKTQPESTFAFKPPTAAPDFESATLQRLRDAARRRAEQDDAVAG